MIARRLERTQARYVDALDRLTTGDSPKAEDWAWAIQCTVAEVGSGGPQWRFGIGEGVHRPNSRGAGDMRHGYWYHLALWAVDWIASGFYPGVGVGVLALMALVAWLMPTR